MNKDPVVSNPGLYHVLLENDRVRVLEYRDHPGEETTLHAHPDSVMVTLGSFRRRLVANGHEAEVDAGRGLVRWLPAQEHRGVNIGDSDTHVIFVELKGPSFADQADEGTLGPREG
jgi:beta-alanine degradation protein BauB